jgi:hypothetical protein
VFRFYLASKKNPRHEAISNGRPELLKGVETEGRATGPYTM